MFGARLIVLKVSVPPPLTQWPRDSGGAILLIARNLDRLPALGEAAGEEKENDADGEENADLVPEVSDELVVPGELRVVRCDC